IDRDSLQHHFGAKEHDDHIAADQETDHSKREERAADGQIVEEEGDFAHRRASSMRSPSRGRPKVTIATAPTSATSKSVPASSMLIRCSLHKWRPSVAMCF